MMQFFSVTIICPPLFIFIETFYAVTRNYIIECDFLHSYDNTLMNQSINYGNVGITDCSPKLSDTK